RNRVPFKKLIVKASAGASHCEYSSLNSPLLPRSQVGKFLSGVFQNHRSLFHVAVQEELKLLSDDRDAAVSRMILASDSDQALLHSVDLSVSMFVCVLASQVLICNNYEELQ
ncbi:hypothetical protein L195_g035040, partial [Trifolium pratense]